MDSVIKTDRYIMEGNKHELGRLRNQHDTLKSGMGTLTIAPIDFSSSSLRILDSGTADGLWLRELQTSVQGSHDYVGTDIVPSYFPSTDTPGIQFQVQSITQDWPKEWLNSFDYVHQRLTLPGAGQKSLEKCVRRLVELVKPGGWIELVEAEISGDFKNGPSSQHLEAMIVKMLDFVGVGQGFVTHLADYLTKSGVEDVQTKIFRIPHGAACTDANIAEKSTAHLISTAQGLLGFFQSQGLTIDNTSTIMGEGSFERQLEKELESHGAFFKMRVVWGKKPSLP